MTRFHHTFLLFLVPVFGLTSCEERSSNADDTVNVDTLTVKEIVKVEKLKEPERNPAILKGYYTLNVKDSGKSVLKQFNADELDIIYSLNRVDKKFIGRKDTVVVPKEFATNRSDYSPYPVYLPFLEQVNKVVLINQAIQAWASYENGKRAKWGPTSTGKKSTPTANGLFFANWKSKETRSTVDNDWILKWNFNINNTGGVGWHEYEMPGYPASHSCIRMFSEDAQWLYTWANQWVLNGPNTVVASGTPAVLFGDYPYGQPRPWYKLLEDPAANDLSAEAIENAISKFLPKMLEKQTEREAVAKVN